MIGYTLDELLTDNEGKLPAHSGLGGYPIHYYDRDGGELCAACAQETLDLDGDDRQKVTDFDVYYEGPDRCCDGCGKDMPSAYGDPWAAAEGVEAIR